MIDDRAAADAGEGVDIARLQQFLEQSPVSLQAVALDGHTTHVNRAFETMWGLTLADLDGYSVWNDPQIVANGFRPWLERAFAGETVTVPPVRYDAERTLGRGRSRIVENIIYPVRDADGRVVEAVILHQDVTGRAEAEAALRERDERLRAALSASGTGTFRWDIGSNALEWDESLDALFGLPPGETARSLDAFVALVHPDDRDIVVRACARCASDGVDFDEEFRIVRPDGAVRWLADKGRTFFDRDGKPAYMTGACVDVTERHEGEDARRRALDAADLERRRLHAVLDALPVGVWIADATGRLTHTNEAAPLIWGGAAPHATDIAGYAQYRAWRPDTGRLVEAHEWALARALRTGETTLAEPLDIERFDGTRGHVLNSAAPIRDAEGRITGGVAVILDVTAQRRAADLAKALQALTARLSATVTPAEIADAVVHDGVRAVGAAGGFVALVEPAPADSGDSMPLIRVATSVGYPATVVQRVPYARLDAPFPAAAVARTGEPVWLDSREEARARYAPMVEAYTDTNVHSWGLVPLKAGPRVLGVLGMLFEEEGRCDPPTCDFLTTLADRCADALERARLYREAQAASEAKSGFLATMSHELRTPLNAIIGYSELLLMGVPEPIPDASQAQVVRARTAARHLLGIIDEILTHSRLEAGRETVTLEPVSIAPLVDEVATVIEPLARARGLAFRVDVAPTLPPLHTDAGKLRQILINLLGNAVKFTQSGSISLEVRADTAGVTFTVCDTGIGIGPEDARHVFDPFWQVEQRSAHRQAGTGLGLSVSRQLARLLGGDVSLESRVGEGSRFTVRLPARR